MRAAADRGGAGQSRARHYLSLALARAGLFVHAFGHPFRVPAQEIVATREAGLGAPGFQDACTHALEYRFDDAGRLPEIPVTENGAFPTSEK